MKNVAQQLQQIIDAARSELLLIPEAKASEKDLPRSNNQVVVALEGARP